MTEHTSAEHHTDLKAAPVPATRVIARPFMQPRVLLAGAALTGATVIALTLALGTGSPGAQAQTGQDPNKAAGKPASTARPALTVNAVQPVSSEWAKTLEANGSVTAWQEAVIGPEVGGYRLVEVNASVGDRVRKGQLLARINSDTIAAELAQSRAAAAEAQAQLDEARNNAQRARGLAESGALSSQQVLQYVTAEQTAKARLDSARARVQADELRMAHTRVVAPDDGVISARQATVGSLAQQGQELFRLIRDQRLEWRAEVTASELARIQPGMRANVTVPGAEGKPIAGKVRIVAPTIDPQTRNALVYVDLPAGSAARAGMFARGELVLGAQSALTLPQSAVLLRDGFAYVFVIDANNRVQQTKVSTGRRNGDRIEIASGLKPEARVVASSVAFLSDGDLVSVTAGAPTAASAAVSSRPRPAAI
ncbi:MAG TPA: efflux RND transporter periplasmic adaptor subunit [Burkholderiaceae bacterium]|nr:efflux RND transporter periplasmic adaptor subunit [Burkholderiaceae bacterium]